MTQCDVKCWSNIWLNCTPYYDLYRSENNFLPISDNFTQYVCVHLLVPSSYHFKMIRLQGGKSTKTPPHHDLFTTATVCGFLLPLVTCEINQTRHSCLLSKDKPWGKSYKKSVISTHIWWIHACDTWLMNIVETMASVLLKVYWPHFDINILMPEAHFTNKD